MENIKNRWVKTLRQKASQYEHPARKKGETVTALDLDSLANEIEAFFIALEVKIK